MSQIETIKNMQSKGLGPSAIAERLQIDRKTVRKVMKAEMLVAECPAYDASYPLVQRYVSSLREVRHQERTQELEWMPGEAKVDFGEGDIYDADGEKKAFGIQQARLAEQTDEERP